MKLNDAIEMYPELLIPTGMQGALVGVIERFGMNPVALISKSKVIEHYVSDGMTPEEAEEFYEFNCLGAYVGDNTPAFLITEIK